MIAIVILVVIVVLLLIAAASRESTLREDDSAPSENDSAVSAELPGKPLHFTWEKNYFIDKHLHRDDKTLERHKRNQFPF